MTPEQYHLTEGPKLREQLAKEQEHAQKSDAEQDRAALLAAAKKAGVILPKSAKPDGSNSERWRVGNLRIEISGPIEVAPRYLRGKTDRLSDRLYRRRRALCDNLTTAGAKRFAAFVKTKYGKDADDATIAKAHGEWLDLLSACTC